MELQYALIRAGVVENIIIADDDFIPLIQNDWDHVLRVNDSPNIPHIGIGWTYVDGAFVAPVINQVEAE